MGRNFETSTVPNLEFPNYDSTCERSYYVYSSMYKSWLSLIINKLELAFVLLSDNDRKTCSLESELASICACQTMHVKHVSPYCESSKRRVFPLPFFVIEETHYMAGEFLFHIL